MKNNLKRISRFMFATMLLLAGVIFSSNTLKAEASYYYPYITNLTQSGYETNAVTISWEMEEDRDEVTAGYHIYVGETYSDSKLVGNATTTSYRITGLEDGKSYYVKVQPYSTEGIDATSTRNITVQTIPAKVKNFHQERWYYFIHTLDVQWDQVETADNIIVTLYNSKGKKVGKSQKLYGRSTNASFDNMKDEVYTVTVQAEKTVNGQKYTTPVSKIECFNQARITSAKVKSKKLTVRWGKIGGATGYDIYVSTMKTKGYKKVKSVGKTTSKVTIPKFKGKAFNPKKKYYVYVETKKKSGKTISKSGRLYYWNTKDTKYDYFQ